MPAFRPAHDTYINTEIAADRAITAEQFAQLNLTLPASTLSRFIKESSDVDNAQAAQSPLTSDLTQKAARLTMFVSHFHQVLDLAIARSHFAVGTRSYYGRDVSATALPDLSTYEAVADAAAKIATGEAARALADGSGYLAMSMPSAGDVSGHEAAFLSAFAASQRAQVKTDQERSDVSTLYPDAQALAVDLCDTIEFFYRKDPDPASRRAKCSRWGVVYFYEPNATPDPVVPPAPVTPPQP